MSAQVKTAERAYTVLEAAELKSVSYEFVLKAIKRTDAGHLPAVRVGRGYRINAGALEAWWAGMESA